MDPKTMHAAVVNEYGAPPRYEQVPTPAALNRHELTVEVLAAGLHPRVRSGASGRHYTSTGKLPLIPGIDGVGRRSDGRLIYFVAVDDALGTMAERALADERRAIELADGVDAVKVAAAMNPAMSSWVALRRRVPLQAGQSVLVLGATGNAGTMAVQVAKRLGAGHVVAAGRDRARLEAVSAAGADETVQLSSDDGALASAAADVDIVIDYLWGGPTEAAITALLTARPDRSRPLDWIQIGAVAGPTIELPSVALRSANLRLQGCGQGSVSPTDYLGELPSLIDEIVSGSISIDAVTAPLSEVERVWSAPETPGVRTVLLPYS